MAFLSISEVMDIIIMTVFVGFIFGDVFSRVARIPSEDEIKSPGRWNWENFKFAVIVTAPAIILHEFGHKFVAMAFGLHAVFNAAYGWLTVGLVLKLVGFPFVFFVPAYVSIIGNTSPLNYSLIAFAGPGVNLILWISAIIVQKTAKLSGRSAWIVQISKQINMFLFIFNMLPIPGFDGSKVFSGLFSAF